MGKLRPQWGSFSSTSDWQIFKSLIILSIGDDVTKRILIFAIKSGSWYGYLLELFCHLIY